MEIGLELSNAPGFLTLGVLVLALGSLVFNLLKDRGRARYTAFHVNWTGVVQANGLETIERVGGSLFERRNAHPNAVGKLEGQRFRAATETRQDHNSRRISSYDVTVVEFDLRPLLSPAVCASRSWARPQVRAGDAPPELEDVLQVTHQNERDELLLRDPGAVQSLFALSRIGDPVIEGGVLQFEIRGRLTGEALGLMIQHLRGLVSALQAVRSGTIDVWNV